MIRTPLKKSSKIIVGLVSVFILLSLYTGLSISQHKQNPDDTTIPTWSQLKDGVGKCFEKNGRSGERWLVEDLKATMTRLLLGMAIGVSCALILGLLMGCLGYVDAFLMPPLTFLALIPPTAALAVYFVISGTGMAMYLLMIAFGIGATLARSIYLSVHSVPSELLYKAYTLGASKCEIIVDVILRVIFPQFINAVRLHIAPAMIFLIAAEMVVGDVGFGYRIRLQSRLMNMNVVYPYLAVLAAIGFTMDWILRMIQNKLCPWFENSERK